MQDLSPSLFIRMFGDPLTNPMGWDVQALGDLVSFHGGGTPSRKRDDFYIGGNIPWVTPKDITEAAVDGSSAKLIPPNCILMVVKSKILTRRLPLAINVVPVCLNQDLKGLSRV